MAVAFETHIQQYLTINIKNDYGRELGYDDDDSGQLLEC